MGVLWRLISEDGSGGHCTTLDPEVVTLRWRTHAHTPALPMATDNLLEAAQVLSSRSHTFPVQFRRHGPQSNSSIFLKFRHVF